MQQVLFRLPDPTGSFPEGLPLYAYGAMLFFAFAACIAFTSWRAKRMNIPLKYDQIQDLAILLFLSGILGARFVYVVQYKVEWSRFFRIWDGGIVLYGGLIGGGLAFVGYYFVIVKKLNVGLWKMADLAAPAVAIGVAVGRIGCLCNGCCYGLPAGEGAIGIEFPMLTAPAREELTSGRFEKKGDKSEIKREPLQTSVGFSLVMRPPLDDDWRTKVADVEVGGQAASLGFQPGDVISRFAIAGEWRTNALVISGKPEALEELKKALKDIPHKMIEGLSGRSDALRIDATPEELRNSPEITRLIFRPIGGLSFSDEFTHLVLSWPRGRNSVALEVERGGQTVTLGEYRPKSIPLHPTQLYETISMVLLILLLMAFYPLKRHDGQMIVVFIACYAVHRFLNEILRTEPVEGFRMTLSQNISIGMFLFAVVLELFLRRRHARLTATTPVSSVPPPAAS